MLENARFMIVVALCACGPQPAPEDSATSGTPATTTGSSTDADTGGPATTTDVPTTTVAPEETTTVETTTVETTTTTGSTSQGATSEATTGASEMQAWDCPLGWPDATAITGTTPIGPFEGAFAGFGRSGGECGGRLTIQIVPTEPAKVDDLFTVTSLFIDLSVSEWSDNIVLGTGPALFGVRAEGLWGEQLAEAMGEVTITAFEPPPDWRPDPNNWPQMIGDFAVAGDGWDLGGHFEADYCGNLSVLCP